MLNSRREPIIIIGLIVLLGIVGYMYINKKNSVIIPRNTTETPNSNTSSSSGKGEKFVFLQDYTSPEQQVYSGGDWPSGTEIITFKKGDIVKGEYRSLGCQGAGCSPAKVVQVIVSGQNEHYLAIDATILAPLK